MSLFRTCLWASFGSVSAEVVVRKNLRYNGSSAEADESCGHCMSVSRHSSSCQCLDLYFDAQFGQPASLFLFTHGGLWYSGERSVGQPLCHQIVEQSNGTMACATVGYELSADLGGCCNSKDCQQTYQTQAAQIVTARDYLATTWSRNVDGSNIVIGGHSAGGHLSVVLGLKWAEFTNSPEPTRFVSIEGIHNIPVWMTYNEQHWRGEFTCATFEAFGKSDEGLREGSPTLWLEDGSARPVAPILAIHSPQDDYVQESQASELVAALPAGGHSLDVKGRCVTGQHEDTLQGDSAASLAACILDFANGEPSLATIV